MSETAGPRRIRTTYQTAGLTWRADYHVVINATETAADLSAWVSILNGSGKAYPNTRLKLVAGDVNLAKGRDGSGGSLFGDEEESEGFEEKAFFEYHLYTLPRRADIASDSVKQLVLFPTARGVPVTKEYYFLSDLASDRWRERATPLDDARVQPQSQAVDVFIRLDNRNDHGLGLPLPRGKVRAYEVDSADDTIELIGESLIDHTPRNESLLLRMGRAFDIVGERVQVAHATNTQSIVDTIEVRLRNHKAEAVQVRVRERLYRWHQWEVIQSSHDYQKLDS